MKDFRTRQFGSLLGLLVVLCMSASAPAAELIRIGHSAWVADAPTRIAAARGEFEAAGVRVELSEHSSGRAALETLLSKDVELALAAPTPIAQALLEQPPEGRHGGDLVVLASVALTNRTHFIIANARRDIDRPADLEGRRIGLVPGSSSEFIWSRFVRASADGAGSLRDRPRLTGTAPGPAARGRHRCGRALGALVRLGPPGAGGGRHRVLDPLPGFHELAAGVAPRGSARRARRRSGRSCRATGRPSTSSTRAPRRHGGWTRSTSASTPRRWSG
ncbi:MAG: ABC transporter substrate-binding protein [Gammaproteobacteria bacterium]|nr:ABC transporter substrate-binding protein [Gammaproteobacteria bacterium]